MSLKNIFYIVFNTLPTICKHFSTTAKLTWFAYQNSDSIEKLKNASTKDEKINAAIELAKKVFEFKKQNPADFDELCELISELANIYESDEGVRKSISALM